MERINIVIYGAGGFGREVAAMLRYSSLAEEYKLMGFIDDSLAPGYDVNGLSVLGSSEYLLSTAETCHVCIAIANTKNRKQLVNRLATNKKLIWPNIIHPHAQLHDKNNIEIGQGNIICDQSILTTNIELGDFNLINLGCTIGHDSVIGNYCSMMPAVNLSGGSILKDGVYIGSGANIIKSATLGEYAIIGSGAMVNKNIPPHTTAVGIPVQWSDSKD